jgi:hypothetical protein
MPRNKRQRADTPEKFRLETKTFSKIHEFEIRSRGLNK